MTLDHRTLNLSTELLIMKLAEPGHHQMVLHGAYAVYNDNGVIYYTLYTLMYNSIHFLVVLFYFFLMSPNFLIFTAEM